MQGASLESARGEMGRDHAAQTTPTAGAMKTPRLAAFGLMMRQDTTHSDLIIASTPRRRNPQKMTEQPWRQIDAGSFPKWNSDVRRA